MRSDLKSMDFMSPPHATAPIPNGESESHRPLLLSVSKGISIRPSMTEDQADKIIELLEANNKLLLQQVRLLDASGVRNIPNLLRDIDRKLGEMQTGGVAGIRGGDSL